MAGHFCFAACIVSFRAKSRNLRAGSDPVRGSSRKSATCSLGVPIVICAPRFAQSLLPTGPLLSPGPRPAMPGRGSLPAAGAVLGLFGADRVFSLAAGAVLGLFGAGYCFSPNSHTSITATLSFGEPGCVATGYFAPSHTLASLLIYSDGGKCVALSRICLAALDTSEGPPRYESVRTDNTLRWA